MRMIFKTIFTVVVILAVLGALLVGVLCMAGVFSMGFDSSGSFYFTVNGSSANGDEMYEQALSAVIKEQHTGIFVYGEDCSIPAQAEYKQLNSLNPADLHSAKKYNVIVINNIHGNCKLKESDFELLKKYTTQKGYALIYFGKDYLDSFAEYGVIQQAPAAHYFGFTVRSSGGTCIYKDGPWTEETQRHFVLGNRDLVNEYIFEFLYEVINVF